MNQELTQRIIGAIVLTALAAIFIPMLFEDPVDNSGQVVSELTIPEEPPITMDDSFSKLPRNADDIAPLPDETVETPEKPETDSITEMDSTTPPMEEQDLAGDPNDPDLPGEGPGSTDEPIMEMPADNGAVPAPDSMPLDTGEVGEVKKSIKKPLPVKAISKPELPQKTQPIEAKPIPAKPLKPATKSVKAPSSLSRYYLQAGSFSKKENAMTLSETIRKQGMPVILETIQTSRGEMYRLRVGPELDKKRAASMKSKLEQQNIGSILVTE
jgi:DedD protein